jgi:hypothetical protein
MILFTLMMMFMVLPAVGLAIDAGVLFAMKAKLQMATDGAALAAARSLSRGMDLASQKSSAQATAQKFFNANLTAGWLGLRTPTIAISWPAAPPKTTIVHVDTSVVAPTYFMRILGYNSSTLHAQGSANRRDVNIVMVLDRSGSLAADCSSLRSAAVSFVQSFVNGRDNLALITFGTTYRTDFALDADGVNTDFLSRPGGQDMVTLINNINCVGGTNAGSAYYKAYLALQTLNQPGALNVILFFTDGQPTAIHMTAIPIKTGSGSTCTSKTAKNGVLTTGGTSPWGVNIAVETQPPGSVPNPDWRTAADSANCYYAGGSAPNYRYSSVANDVSSVAPNTSTKDVNGIALTGYKSISTSSGAISVTATNINNAAWNILDNAAAQVRSQSMANGLQVITYAIGFTGAIDTTLLNRVANTPSSTCYNSNQPVGLYVYAANGAQLQSAFAQLASDILRISM